MSRWGNQIRDRRRPRELGGRPETPDPGRGGRAGTTLRPKSLLAITETYVKAPGDDVYANGPVTYVRIGALPEPGNYVPIVAALQDGDYFVTSGEVLIPSHSYDRQGLTMTLVADVEWTFPLDFVEVVVGDGERTTTYEVSARD